MEKHIITHVGLLDAQVCSCGNNEEALEYLRIHHPAGTANNWQMNNEGNYAPLQCADDKKRTHYMFTC